MDGIPNILVKFEETLIILPGFVKILLTITQEYLLKRSTLFILYIFEILSLFFLQTCFKGLLKETNLSNKNTNLSI